MSLSLRQRGLKTDATPGHTTASCNSPAECFRIHCGFLQTTVNIQSPSSPGTHPKRRSTPAIAASLRGASALDAAGP